MPRSITSRLIRLVPAALLVVSAGAFTGCGPEDDESDTSGPESSSGQAGDASPDLTPEQAADTVTEPASEEPTSEQPPASEDGGLIKDAYAGKLTIRCTFEQEGNKGTAYIKSSAHLRMDMATPQGEMHMLKLDRTTYMWGGGLPQGMKFDGQKLNESFGQQFEQFTPEEFEEHAQGDEVQCEEYSGDDSMFDVPAGVTFSSIGGQMP